MDRGHRWGLVGVLLLCEALGQIAIMSAARQKKTRNVMLGMGVAWYAAAGYLFYWLLRYGGSIAWVVLAWSMGALFIGTALGVYEGDKFSYPRIGSLVLAAMALVLWEMG